MEIVGSLDEELEIVRTTCRSPRRIWMTCPCRTAVSIDDPVRMYLKEIGKGGPSHRQRGD